MFVGGDQRTWNWKNYSQQYQVVLDCFNFFPLKMMINFLFFFEASDREMVGCLVQMLRHMHHLLFTVSSIPSTGSQRGELLVVTHAIGSSPTLSPLPHYPHPTPLPPTLLHPSLDSISWCNWLHSSPGEDINGQNYGRVLLKFHSANLKCHLLIQNPQCMFLTVN
jgi:hypothetical protein